MSVWINGRRYASKSDLAVFHSVLAALGAFAAGAAWKGGLHLLLAIGALSAVGNMVVAWALTRDASHLRGPTAPNPPTERN